MLFTKNGLYNSSQCILSGTGENTTHTVVQEKHNSFQHERNMPTMSYNGQCS